ncbi:MAG: ribonuclease III [Clostridia bacterium]|nr:ribonuclease III [Clostridia bacterium]MBQ8861370.1 ribonuclease III [Clostridia bacterium]
MSEKRKNVKIKFEAEELEAKLGYTFADKKLLRNALCHSSYSNERKSEHVASNERLEFLGDSVLSIITSEFLYLTFPERPEGELSNLRREIVDSVSLAGFARKFDLGKYMFFGNGEEKNGGRDRTSNLEDAFEALAAAMYLDGGIECVKKFFLPLVREQLENIFAMHRFNDPKSLLQEIVQQNGETLCYEKVDERGPDHDKRFTCVVKLNSNVIGKGEGKRIQEAEMNAARDALRLFGEQQGNK